MAKDWITESKSDSKSSWESGSNNKEVKMGRPSIPEEKKRKPRFTMNMNDSEYKLIEEAAEQLGVPVAVYIRQQELLAAEKQISKKS